MTSPAAQAEQYLDTALGALASDREDRSILDALPVPVYMTDSQGAVTYWNRACVEFAGREPQLGSDRWCVTWQLYTLVGERLPHEKCPMAVAIREKTAVRGKIAIAERPDGKRVAFRAYPTPLFDEDGTLTGAVNMLIDVSQEQAQALSEQAARCRRLSIATDDRRASDILDRMAEGYDETAAALQSR